MVTYIVKVGFGETVEMTGESDKLDKIVQQMKASDQAEKLARVVANYDPGPHFCPFCEAEADSHADHCAFAVADKVLEALERSG